MAKLNWVMSHVDVPIIMANVSITNKNLKGEDIETGEDVVCESEEVKKAASALEAAVAKELGI